MTKGMMNADQIGDVYNVFAAANDLIGKGVEPSMACHMDVVRAGMSLLGHIKALKLLITHSADDTPKCWRCEHPGRVSDGTGYQCIECAGRWMAEMRDLLKEIDAAVTDGLPLLPKIASRVEFVRECVKMQREIGSGELRPFYPPAPSTPAAR